MYRNCQTFCLKSGVLFSLSHILHNILWINTVNLSPTIDWSRRGINGLYCGNIHTEIFPGYTYKTFQNVTKRFKTSSLQKRLKRQVYKYSSKTFVKNINILYLRKFAGSVAAMFAVLYFFLYFSFLPHNNRY